jgi:hypothetical protein
MFTEGMGPLGRVFRRFRGEEGLPGVEEAAAEPVAQPEMRELAALPPQPADDPQLWKWAGELGHARVLSRGIADLAAASSIAAVNVSVQAARAGEGSAGLLLAAEDLDRIAAQTRRAAMSLARLAEALEQDVARRLPAGVEAQ